MSKKNHETVPQSQQVNRRAVIIHGYDATPTDHWFEWLAAQLESAGYNTAIPALPHSETPDAGAWEAVAGAAIGVPDQHTIVVAHSLGCLTTLRHLSSLSGEWQLGGLVLVAGFTEPFPKLPALQQFIDEQPLVGCDLATIAKRVARLLVLRSDVDPIVPVERTDRLAQLLGTDVEVVAGAGHFLAQEGITTLPQALQILKDESTPLASES